MRRLLAVGTILSLGLFTAFLAVPQAHSIHQAGPTELRGLWVVRSSLASRTSVAKMVEGAHAAGFNTLLVQVRGRGDAYFSGGIEPRAEALAVDPSFDPLGYTLQEAHARGMSVMAWVTVNLVASAHDLPRAPGHVVNRAPEWLMVPRALAQEMAGLDPHSPGYIGRIARWSRTKSSEVEGLYSSPIPPAASAHVVAVIADLVRRYAVDGVHLDYVRYPGPDFDFGRAALDEFRASVVPDLTRAEAARLESRFREDVLAYVDMFPQRWAAFRRTRLTAMVMRLREAIRRERPAVVVSAAVLPDASEAAALKFQDWTRWLETDLLDAACPMAYTQDAVQFESQVRYAVDRAGSGEIWAGIGAYRLTSDQTIERITTARRAGASGVVLFSYDSLIEPPQSMTYLADVGRAAFATGGASAGGDR